MPKLYRKILNDEAKRYHQTLIEARTLIEDEKNWTHHGNARDAIGNICGPLDNEACCWCAVGALYKVTGSMNRRSITLPLDYLDLAARYAGYLSAQNMNDKGNHALVIHTFEEAIKLVPIDLGDY